MTITIENEKTTIDNHRELAGKIKALKDEKAKVGKTLRSEGIEADEQIKADLKAVATEAEKVVQGLSVSLTAAERRKAELDKRIDAGDDTVTPLEAMEADMAVRSTKGKQSPADMALRKAKRALEPFTADDNLALLAAETLKELVDVPVLIRKRASDVHGIGDAIVLSQISSTERYGTSNPSGRVQLTEIGSTGLDLEALESALQNTGADVHVFPGAIDYDVALWPVTRLAQPSVGAVAHFASIFAQTFDAVLKKPGNKAGNSYQHYDALWNTISTDLEITAPGEAKGRLVAMFGVEGERPPVSQMQEFVNRTLSHFDTGVHTAAGLLQSIEVVEVVDSGPWVVGDFMSHREYAQGFGLTIELTYVFEAV